MANPERRRLLRLILTRPHRYRRNRAITMAVTMAILFGVPLIGLARLDLWGDAHMALLRPVAFAQGLTAVLAAIVAFYVVTFLVNMPAGRMFCGFGCPVGQLSRFSDAIDAFPADAARRRRGWLELWGFALALSLAVTLWWTAPATFLTWPEGAYAAALVLAVAAAAVLHGRRWRWSFCRGFCPIGLYYSVVETGAPFGIDFDPDGTCIDCDACDTVCPVGLAPRALDAVVPAPGGLAFDGMPGLNHCLHCGLCVEVCEHVTHKRPGHPAMGLRRMHRKPRRVIRPAGVSIGVAILGQRGGGPLLAVDSTGRELLDRVDPGGDEVRLQDHARRQQGQICRVPVDEIDDRRREGRRVSMSPMEGSASST